MQLVPCAIALGSNLGDSQTILKAALETLDRTSGISVVQRSHLYSTKALILPDSPSQPDYLNQCALLKTALTPHELLQVLLEVEIRFGRVRQQRWSARTLDLDLLLFDDVILNTPDLQIPHPRMLDRAFVLVPLAEIAPDWVEPVTGNTIAQLVQFVDRSGVRQAIT